MIKQIEKFRNDYRSFNLHELDIRKDQRIESAKKWLLSQIVPIEKIVEIEDLPLNVVLELKSSLGL